MSYSYLIDRSLNFNKDDDQNDTSFPSNNPKYHDNGIKLRQRQTKQMAYYMDDDDIDDERLANFASTPFQSIYSNKKFPKELHVHSNDSNKYYWLDEKQLGYRKFKLFWDQIDRERSILKSKRMNLIYSQNVSSSSSSLPGQTNHLKPAITYQTPIKSVISSIAPSNTYRGSAYITLPNSSTFKSSNPTNPDNKTFNIVKLPNAIPSNIPHSSYTTPLSSFSSHSSFTNLNVHNEKSNFENPLTNYDPLKRLNTYTNGTVNMPHLHESMKLEKNNNRSIALNPIIKNEDDCKYRDLMRNKYKTGGAEEFHKNTDLLLEKRISRLKREILAKRKLLLTNQQSNEHPHKVSRTNHSNSTFHLKEHSTIYSHDGESKEKIQISKNDICSICKDRFGDNDDLLICSICSSLFHEACSFNENSDILDLNSSTTTVGKIVCANCSIKRLIIANSNKYKDAAFDSKITCLNDVLSILMKQKCAQPFLLPVDSRTVPDYYDIIKEPIDFKTIERRLNKGLYSSDDEFTNDVKLIFGNCRLYNKAGSIYVKYADYLEQLFQTILSSYHSYHSYQSNQVANKQQ